MKKLHETKAYYLGDLSDEQLIEFDKQYESLMADGQTKGLDLSWYDSYKNDLVFRFGNHDGKNLWGFYEDLYYCKDTVNALTLFKETENERIISLQLEEQKLNNRLIEIANEMKNLNDIKVGDWVKNDKSVVFKVNKPLLEYIKQYNKITKITNPQLIILLNAETI